LLGTVGPGHSSASLEDVWRDVRQGGQYVGASRQDLHKAEELFSSLLQQKNALSLKTGWEELGFSLEDMQFQGKAYLVLRENPSRKNGQGFYLFSKESNSDTLLTIPHSFKDIGTGSIGLDLFTENTFKAIAFNTVPRSKKSDDGSKSEHDFGKLPDSFFVALTKAFATAVPGGKFLQLHGFNQDIRASEAGSTAGLILSSGSEKIPDTLPSLQKCLQNMFSEKVLIYPKDVLELGGTTNISGKILRQYGHRGFIHIEINKAIRDQLIENVSVRQSFGGCLEKL